MLEVRTLQARRSRNFLAFAETFDSSNNFNGNLRLLQNSLKRYLREIFDAFAFGDFPEALEERPQVLGTDAAVVAQVANEQLGLKVGSKH